VVVAALAFAAGVVLTSYMLSSDVAFDSAHRLLTAKQWLAQPQGPISLKWSPVFLHCLAGIVGLVERGGTGLEEVSRGILASRIFVLAFSAMTVVALHGLVADLFDSTAAFFSACLLVTYPFFLQWATVPLEVVPFIFFAVASLRCARRCQRSGRWRDLVFTLVACVGACAFRQEGWLLIPVLWLVLLRAPRLIAWRAVVFGPLALVYPAAYMFREYRQLGSPFRVATDRQEDSVGEIVREAVPLLDRCVEFPLLLVDTLPMITILAIGLGIGVAARRKTGLVPAGVAALFLGALVLARTTMGVTVIDRYVLVCGVLLIPYAGLGLREAWQMPHRVARPACALVLVVAMWNSLDHAFDRRFRLTAADHALVSWMSEHVDTEDRYLIDADDWSIFGVLLYSGVHTPLGNFTKHGELTDAERSELQSAIQERRLDFVLLHNELGGLPELHRILASDPGFADERASHRFVHHTSTPDYDIYEVQYPR